MEKNKQNGKKSESNIKQNQNKSISNKHGIEIKKRGPECLLNAK